jgi:hypothetical protein
MKIFCYDGKHLQIYDVGESSTEDLELSCSLHGQGIMHLTVWQSG